MSIPPLLVWTPNLTPTPLTIDKPSTIVPSCTAVLKAMSTRRQTYLDREGCRDQLMRFHHFTFQLAHNASYDGWQGLGAFATKLFATHDVSPRV